MLIILQDHPRNLIPELCNQFYHLGWVTGTGGGVSIKQGYVYTCMYIELTNKITRDRYTSFGSKRGSFEAIICFGQKIYTYRIGFSPC